MTPAPKPHPEYFIKNGDLTFACNRVLFRIHSHFFLRESSHWRKELTGSPDPGDRPLTKGINNAPVDIDEKPEDFEQLLWVFYNPKFGDYSKATPQNWETILRYSHRWEFTHVKELATRKLQNCEMDLVKRIKLYQENKVQETLLYPLYTQIASRDEMLTSDEAEALGHVTFYQVYQARERLRSQPVKSKPTHCPVRAGMKDTEIADIISSVFKLSLKDIQTQTST